MSLKSIWVEFHTDTAERRGRHFSGWVYYMVSGDDYLFYEVLPEQKDHRLLATLKRSEVKEIVEKIL
jgi:hypothetical protein